MNCPRKSFVTDRGSSCNGCREKNLKRRVTGGPNNNPGARRDRTWRGSFHSLTANLPFGPAIYDVRIQISQKSRGARQGIDYRKMLCADILVHSPTCNQPPYQSSMHATTSRSRSRMNYYRTLTILGFWCLGTRVDSGSPYYFGNAPQAGLTCTPSNVMPLSPSPFCNISATEHCCLRWPRELHFAEIKKKIKK